MDLSPKAVRYLIDALRHYREHLDCRLEAADSSDDELADLGNDRQYGVALEQDLQSHHEDLLKGVVSLQH